MEIQHTILARTRSRSEKRQGAIVVAIKNRMVFCQHQVSRPLFLPPGQAYNTSLPVQTNSMHKPPRRL